MALTTAEITALATIVANRIAGTVIGREASASSQAELSIATAAAIYCDDIAPGAPEAILKEAAIRLAGWFYGNRPHAAEVSFKDPSGGEWATRFNNTTATANGYRSSGASALLGRYVVRRGGRIAGTEEVEAT